MGGTRIIGRALLPVLMLLASCGTRPKEEACVANDVRILNADDPLELSFDEVVDSVSYIALDSRKCVVGDVETVRRDGDMLFVKDSKGLYAFTTSGAFVSQIGTFGKGPQEYMYIQTFYLDTKNKHVYIVSYPDKKLLEYSYDGRFVAASPLPAVDGCMDNVVSHTPDSLVVYNALSNDVMERPAEYILLSDVSGVWKREQLLKGIGNRTRSVRYPFLYNPMTVSHNGIYAISALSDIVYRYNGKDGMSPAFRVPLPKLCPTATVLGSLDCMDFFSLKDALEERGYGLGITGITTVDGNFVLAVNGAQTVITDGRVGVVVAPMVYDGNIGTYVSGFFAQGISGEYMGHIDALTLLEAKENIMKGGNRHLKRLCDTLSAEDNPVVFQYHFKNGLLEILKRKLHVHYNIDGKA
ncbi:MAG: 6-bladed beta-propeller [Bacteroidaceae bacterium]|nr:6-bladed beta-propeller [Bacteroidaceae bacterium]